MKKTDVIIVGAGALGVFHAYHALRSGLSVRLFERNSEPRDATVRNFGQVVPSGMDITWQQYGRRSLAIYKHLQSLTDITVRPNGSVYIASDEDEMQLIEELRAINVSNDYSSELLTKATCLEKYPGLRADYCKGGLFFPDEITVDARQMIHRVIAYLKEQMGLIYHQATPVLAVEKQDGNCCVTCHRGEHYEAEKVIVCSGAEFKLLFPDLFDKSDLEISLLQMMQTVTQKNQRVLGNILTGLSIRRYESFRECPSYQAIVSKEDADAFWKKWSIHILFKQCDDGSFIIGDSHVYVDAADADSASFDSYTHVNNYMLDEAQKIFDLEDYSLQRTWLGIYSQCKQRDIFNHTIDNDIHIVTGIGGKGMTGSAGYTEAHVASLFNVSVN